MNLLAFIIQVEYERSCLKKSQASALSEYTGTKISEKQKQLLVLIAKGFTDIAISIDLKQNLDTIKYHKKQIFYKLHVSSSIEAVVKAIQYDIISLDQL